MLLPYTPHDHVSVSYLHQAYHLNLLPTPALPMYCGLISTPTLPISTSYLHQAYLSNEVSYLHQAQKSQNTKTDTEVGENYKLLLDKINRIKKENLIYCSNCAN